MKILKLDLVGAKIAPIATSGAIAVVAIDNPELRF